MASVTGSYQFNTPTRKPRRSYGLKIGYNTPFSKKDTDSSTNSSPESTNSSSSAQSANFIAPFPSPRSSPASVTSSSSVQRPHITPAQYAKMAVQAGRVKSVLSGDTIILTSIVNPAQEKILSLAYITAPRLNKTGDEPWAFESRDYLRKSLVGKNIQFQVLYEIPTTKRQFGVIFLEDGVKFPQAVVREGWAKIKDAAGRKEDTEKAVQLLNELKLLESQARAEDLGVWSPSSGQLDVQHDLGNSDEFMAEYKGQSVDGVVERILSGDRMLVRLIMPNNKHYQLMTLVAGIRAPSTERVNPSNQQVQPAEPLGNEAKAFVETRLLQRNVKVDILGVSPQNQLIATVRHPKGSIANFLLAAGLARCSDHHSTLLGSAMPALRQAERDAQVNKRGLYEGHVAKSKSGADAQDVTVTRVFSADTLFVRNKAGVEKRINISSVRGPRTNEPSEALFKDAAKEFLRKKVIGKHVRVSVDGSRPATDGYEAKDVATVTLNDTNIGLALAQEGWVSIIRHKRDDTDRAPNYDELLAAQETAKEEKKGMWSPKAPAVKTYVDASETAQKAKMQLQTLQRQKKIPAIVDFVKSGSRFTVLIPREGAKLNFVLGGIRAPKSARNPSEQSEPFGQEAHDFATKRCSQRDVEIDVHNIDKVGGFIGELFVNRESFAKALVEEGYATVHEYSAEQSGNAQELLGAQGRAKAARKGLWKDWDPSQDEEAESAEAAPENGTNDDSAPVERQKDYRDVVITNIDDEGKLKLQIIGTGTSSLDTMMSQFRTFHLNPTNNAGLPADPKAGDFVSAKFSEDGQWYRARIRANDRPAKVAEVQYIDFGNKEKIPWAKLRPLQPQFSIQKLKAQAQDAVLSLLQLPASKEYLDDSIAYITELTANKELVANVDYTDKDGTLYVTLFDPKTSDKLTESINSEVVAEGLAMVPRKLKPWERSFGDVLKALKKVETVAKEDERRGMWEYGDLTED